MTVEERFWSKVERRGPDECWLWRAARNSDGYGVIRVGGRAGRLVLAHRLSLVLDGRDPGPLVSRHSCDMPACVNPRHLAPGTQLQNMRDACERKAMNQGAKNGAAVLDEAKVRSIRSLVGHLSGAEIARRLGVPKTTVRDVISGKTWAHVSVEAA